MIKSAMIAVAIFAAVAAAQASDRACYRSGFVCDCATGICEGGAVMPLPKAKGKSTILNRRRS